MKDGVRYIVVDQMSPKTKFVYDNFPDYDIDAASDGRKGGNVIAGMHLGKSAHTVSCLPGMNLPAIPGPTLPAWLMQPNGHKIDEGEVIIDEFSAAIALKILIQGRLFVSNQALYFHSFFNDSIMFFGRETKIKIMLKDIKDIKK